MTIDDVINYYGTCNRFHDETGMSANTFLNWKEWGRVPWRSQLLIERLTDGKLIADKKPEAYRANKRAQ